MREFQLREPYEHEVITTGTRLTWQIHGTEKELEERGDEEKDATDECWWDCTF